MTEDFYITSSEWLLRFFRNRIGLDNINCEDLRQETLLGLFVNIQSGKYDSDISKLNTYTLAIALNKLRDYLGWRERHDQKYYRISESLIIKQTPFEIDIFPALINKMVNQNHVAVLRLNFYQDYTIPEIAAELNISIFKVSELKHQAIKLLRRECRKEDYV